MRRFAASFALLGFLLSASVTSAAQGKICKVLPQFLDQKGRQSLSPSLYERDAYQAYLHKHLHERSALQMVVEWKASGVDWQKLKLRAELRGLVTNSLQNFTLETPVKKSGLFGNWAKLKISGDDFKKFGELVAWRVTLWEGDRQLAAQESFLWSGVSSRAH
jgi:hypothetical protein